MTVIRICRQSLNNRLSHENLRTRTTISEPGTEDDSGEDLSVISRWTSEKSSGLEDTCGVSCVPQLDAASLASLYGYPLIIPSRSFNNPRRQSSNSSFAPMLIPSQTRLDERSNAESLWDGSRELMRVDSYAKARVWAPIDGNKNSSR